MPLTVSTIGDVIDGDYTLTACCYRFGCNHRAELDLEALATRLGRSHSFRHKDLTPKLRCSKCGSKNIGQRLSPPTGSPG
ncbi:hypothetical protein [Chelativorans sp. M5D2P16]|uniref:hypothetical protein n=1 Tax=Chelativorans sp. M5D2P16 TaxID=3095678 RepID=UPI002ACAFB44|nr:hypothetical protein [Chelativorans sp. M5D2P16]MDZ5697836.1 hypothetical protein [Chelativorans sp. M5D2P16]